MRSGALLQIDQLEQVEAAKKGELWVYLEMNARARERVEL